MGPYANHDLTREQVEAMAGPVLLVFGTNWCGYCKAFEPRLETTLRDFPQVQVCKVEDGPGRPLGRSFRVKLWPNLVFLCDGQLKKQLARPEDLAEVRAGLEDITTS